MAASSWGDIPAQLAALLGKEVAQMRKTDENQISVIDVAMVVTGGSQHDAARALRRLSDQHPEVGPNWPLLKFPGKRQRDTPVTDAKGIFEIIMLLPGRQAARLRRGTRLSVARAVAWAVRLGRVGVSLFCSLYWGTRVSVAWAVVWPVRLGRFGVSLFCSLN